MCTYVRRTGNHDTRNQNCLLINRIVSKFLCTVYKVRKITEIISWYGYYFFGTVSTVMRLISYRCLFLWFSTYVQILDVIFCYFLIIIMMKPSCFDNFVLHHSTVVLLIINFPIYKNLVSTIANFPFAFYGFISSW